MYPQMEAFQRLAARVTKLEEVVSALEAHIVELKQLASKVENLADATLHTVAQIARWNTRIEIVEDVLEAQVIELDKRTAKPLDTEGPNKEAEKPA